MNKGRISNLRKELSNNQNSNIFVSNPHNIFYLTGFKTLSPSEREAFVLITQNNIFLFTDPRHDVNLPDKSIRVKLLTPQKNLAQNLQEVIKEQKIKELGFEEEDLKFSEYSYLSKKLKAKLKPLRNVIAKLREIKEADEVANIKKTCLIADQCLREVSKFLKIGISEKEIAFKIEFYFKEKGYDISFLPIVAFNKNSAIPHYDSRDGRGTLRKDSVILIDFGALHGNYCSDMTRMFFMPKVSSEIKKTYAKLLKAQEDTIKKINKVKKTKELDKFVRNSLKKSGLPPFFHSTGHGIGLEVHEKPSVSFKSKDKIQNGQVFTIEPGVYYEGKWGMRIEDIVYVKDGQVEILTRAPKKLQIL